MNQNPCIMIIYSLYFCHSAVTLMYWNFYKNWNLDVDTDGYVEARNWQLGNSDLTPMQCNHCLICAMCNFSFSAVAMTFCRENPKTG